MTWLLSSIALFFVGCSAREQAKSVSTTVQAPAAAPVVTQGIATFVDGKVSVADGGELKGLSIGDRVSTSESVTTGAASSCEIQFGKMGIVKVSPNSTIQLKRISLAAARNAIDLGLSVGSISCKVSKLTSKDRFQVITSVASCGVRGTEFVVIQPSGKPMRVAVREGRVAVIPPSFDAAKIDSKAGDANEELADEVIASVMDAAPAVVADQELTVTPTDMASADVAMASLQTRMESALTDASKTPPSNTATQPSPSSTEGVLPEAVGASIKSFAAAVQAAAPKPRALSDDSRKLLQDASLLELKQDTAPASAPESSQSQANPTPTSAPAPAAPVAPEAIVATLKVSDSPLVAGVQASDGNLIVADAQGTLYAISADRKLSWTVKTGNAENENSRPVADSGSVAFAGDKDLCVLDAGTGKIAYTTPLDASDSGIFGRRPAIADGKLYLGTSNGIKTIALADGADAGSIALSESIDATPLASGQMLYLASAAGTFYIIDRGKASIAASIKTSAYQPIATVPAIADNSAFFVDRKGSVVCVDLNTRSVAWQKRLDATKSLNVFQDPVVSGPGIYVYAKSTIYALSKKTGERLFDPIAGVSSTPIAAAGCLWFGTRDGKIVAADTNDGKIKWSRSIPGMASGVPTEAGKTLAFPTDAGSVIFVDVTAALH